MIMLHRFIAYINGLSTRMLRNDANYEKNYIAGRYGAVPYIVNDWTLLPCTTLMWQLTGRDEELNNELTNKIEE